jgi:hypothetical protein
MNSYRKRNKKKADLNKNSTKVITRNFVQEISKPFLQYIVYSTNPSLLEVHGEVYVPHIKKDWVILTTHLSEQEILNIDNVLKVDKCREGQLVSHQ